MSRDPFEPIRRDLERTLRAFEQQMARTSEEVRRTMEEVRVCIEGAHCEFRLHVEGLRWDGTPPRRRPRRRPRSPDAAGPDSPQPAPVRPYSPAGLSGGAEAVVDS